VISVHALDKTFPNGTRALRRVSLTVAPGEIVALLGPSGAGKSTLLRCLNGLVVPSAGRVEIAGLAVDQRPRTLRAVRRRVGMVFQQVNLVGRLTAIENVLTGRLGRRPTLPTLLRRFPPEDYARAAACLARVGLADRAGQRADTLSGGEQQRVGVARVLAQEPAVILADEPVASLDPRAARVVLDLLRRICREDGLTLLASLHQVTLAARSADRVVGLARGAVVFDGPPAELPDGPLERIYGAGWDTTDEDPPRGLGSLAHA
jgi:phosphonate transport system ATP-binding protein